MKIGLLGFGFMGRTHAWCVDNLKYFYKDLPFSAEIAAVSASRPETTSKAADFLGVKGATEDEIINDPSIDIIDICTPNVYHYETLKKAIKRRCTGSAVLLRENSVLAWSFLLIVHKNLDF